MMRLLAFIDTYYQAHFVTKTEANSKNPYLYHICELRFILSTANVKQINLTNTLFLFCIELRNTRQYVPL